jgi:hypothetical protein
VPVWERGSSVRWPSGRMSQCTSAASRNRATAAEQGNVYIAGQRRIRDARLVFLLTWHDASLSCSDWLHPLMSIVYPACAHRSARLLVRMSSETCAADKRDVATASPMRNLITGELASIKMHDSSDPQPTSIPGYGGRARRRRPRHRLDRTLTSLGGVAEMSAGHQHV